MQIALAIRSFWRSWPIFAPEHGFAAPDRALKAVMRQRSEQIEAARRYWACPF